MEKIRDIDIPILEIQQVGANVLIGHNLSEIESKYSFDRSDPLPTSRKDPGNRIIKRIWGLMKANIQIHYLIKG